MSEAKLKTISVTLLLSIIAVSAPIFSWVIVAERRMGVLEQKAEFTSARLEQIAESTSAEQEREERLRIALGAEIKEDLDSINDKLDRIIEDRN